MSGECRALAADVVVAGGEPGTGLDSGGTGSALGSWRHGGQVGTDGVG